MDEQDTVKLEPGGWTQNIMGIRWLDEIAPDDPDRPVTVRAEVLRLMVDWLTYAFSLNYRESGLLITPEERELVRCAVREAASALGGEV